MAYKGPAILINPPGWATVEDLRDNLVEYMVSKSPYAELAKEDMPADMIKEMEKTMTNLAIAIYRTIADIQAGEQKDISKWFISVDDQDEIEITDDTKLVNFSGTEGISITTEDLPGEEIEGEIVGKGVRLNIKLSEEIPSFITETINYLIEENNTTEVTEIVNNLIQENTTTVINTVKDSKGEYKDAYLIDDTISTTETQESIWTILPFNEQVGEFKATVMVRDKVANTINTLISLLSFDYTDAIKVVQQYDLLDNISITLSLGVDALSDKLYATISGMTADAKRIHFCFERCIVSERSQFMSLDLLGSSDLTILGIILNSGALNINTNTSISVSGLPFVKGILDINTNTSIGVESQATGEMSLDLTNSTTSSVGLVAKGTMALGIETNTNLVIDLVDNPLVGYDLLLEFQTNSPGTNTFSPLVTASSGEYLWDVDGNIIPNYSVSETLDGTLKTVKLYGKNSPQITSIDLDDDYIVGTLDFSNPAFSYTYDFDGDNNSNLTTLILPPSPVVASLINFRFRYCGINHALDFSNYNFAGSMYVDNNDITGLTFNPANTGTIITIWAMSNNLTGVVDLSMFTKISTSGMGTQFSFHGNSNLTSLILPVITSGYLSSFGAGNCNLSSLDLSGFNKFSPYGYNLQAFNNPNLSTLIFPTAFDPGGGPSSIAFGGCALSGNIDLTMFSLTLIGTSIDFNNNIGITSVSLPTGPLPIKSLQFQNCNLSTLDISGFNVFGESFIFNVSNNPNLTNVTYATSITASSFYTLDIGDTQLDTLDLSIFSSCSTILRADNSNLLSLVFPTGISGDLRWFEMSGSNIGVPNLTAFITDPFYLTYARWWFTNLGWTATQVNEFLVMMDSLTGGGHISSEIHLEGTNSAPDSTSGGYDGLTAKASLITKGFAVTTS